VSKILKTTNPKVEITGNPRPPRTGAFEVIIDGKEVFSKFKSGRFPDNEEIKTWL